MTQRITLALLLFLGAALAGPPEYEFIPLPRLYPARDSIGGAPNDKRQSSGWATTPDLPNDRAVIWDIAPDNSATVTDIGLVALRRMFGRGCNNHGHMVGFSWITGDGEYAFKWTGGSPVELPNAFDTLGTGTFHSFALKINDAGYVVGAACDNANRDLGPWAAVVWEPDGTMHDLGTLGGEWSFGNDINVANVVAGLSEIAPGNFATRGFRWDPDTGMMEQLDLLPVAGHISGAGNGINLFGDVAGASSPRLGTSGPGTLGAVWFADGTVRRLDPIGVPGAQDLAAIAWDVNDAGWASGTSYAGTFPASWDFRPVLWTPDGTTVDLLQFLPAGTTRGTASGISNTGWIGGLYREPGVNVPRAYVLRPTPATQIGMLMDQVDRLDLGRIGKGLNLQLKVALDKLEDGKPHVAEKLLKVFAFEVKLLERLRRLDAVEADSLLAVVSDVLATLDE
jgi:probable HAF family extracellular repeat protein